MLDRYLKTLSECDCDSDNPLLFWKAHRSSFLILSEFARSLFAIPATSAIGERTFSSVGLIATISAHFFYPTTLNSILRTRDLLIHNSLLFSPNTVI